MRRTSYADRETFAERGYRYEISIIVYIIYQFRRKQYHQHTLMSLHLTRFSLLIVTYEGNVRSIKSLDLL